MVAKYTPRLCRASDSGSRNQIKLNSKLHLMKVYKQANLFEQRNHTTRKTYRKSTCLGLMSIQRMRVGHTTKKAKVQNPSQRNVFKNKFACISIWQSFKLAIIQTRCFVFNRQSFYPLVDMTMTGQGIVFRSCFQIGQFQKGG